MPQLDPHWTYQPSDPGIRGLNHILEGMQKNTHIHVNYDKVRKITQGADENPALFVTLLTEAVQKYTNLDITTLLCYCTFTLSSSASLPLTSGASFAN